MEWKHFENFTNEQVGNNSFLFYRNAKGEVKNLLYYACKYYVSTKKYGYELIDRKDAFAVVIKVKTGFYKLISQGHLNKPLRGVI